MMKSVWIWVMHPPVIGPNARESFSLILGASTIFDLVTVAFVEEGIWYLVPHDKTVLPCARFAPSVALLQAYDINTCYVEAEGLQVRGLTHPSLCLPAISMHRDMLHEKAAHSDMVITV